MASPDDTVCVWGGKCAVDFFFWRTPIAGARRHREVCPGPGVDHGPVALGAQTATAAAATAREWYAPVLYQIGPAASRARSPQEPAEPNFSAAAPQDKKNAKQYICRYASLCRGLLRAKRANQLTTLAAFQPQPVHGARQPEPQACENYTAPSAEYRLSVNNLIGRIKAASL